jgi:uncharacterized protein YegP (UPF0339 family)
VAPSFHGYGCVAIRAIHAAHDTTAQEAGRYIWQWRWHLKAGNGRIIADSGEGYNNEQDCLDGIELVKNSKAAPVRKVA